MTIYFIDPDSGNDANAGTSFGTAWQTITNGATAARIAPGDIIRIKASPAPTSIGSATWTNKSENVTLSGALNATVTNCDTAWTAATNVTATTTTDRKEGTAAANLAIASAFTTGLVAYQTITLTDFSSYQQLTFWIQSSIAVSSGVLELRLCSDTVGLVAVDTFTISTNLVASQWCPLTINKGSALGAAIQSVALYTTSDPGTVTIKLDNILTAKDATSADALSLTSLIGKYTTGESWWGIKSISGTTVKLDQHTNLSFGSVGRGYSGTTESVTTYKRETFKTTPATSISTAVNIINDSGTSGNLIEFTGGWNRTDMSTQTDETWFDGQNGNGYGYVSSSKSYIKLDRLYGVRYYDGFNITGGEGYILNDVGANNCSDIGVNGTWSTVTVGPTINTIRNANANAFDGTSLTITASRLAINSITALSNASHGLNIGSGRLVTQSASGVIKASNNTSNGFRTSTGGNYETIITDDNGTQGTFFTSAGQKSLIKSLTTRSNTSDGFRADFQIRMEILNYTSSGNSSAISIRLSSITGAVDLTVINPTISEATKVSGINNYYSQKVTLAKIGGNVDSHQILFDGGNITSETGADRHTASGIAWKFNVTDSTIFSSYDYPLSLSVAKIGVNASSLVTIKAFVKRNNSSTVSARLRLLGGRVAGVPNDVIATASAASGTYEELTLTCTPTEKGVLEVVFDVFSTTNVDNAVIDDFTITQA
jgi:hypothetical protein